MIDEDKDNLDNKEEDSKVEDSQPNDENKPADLSESDSPKENLENEISTENQESSQPQDETKEEETKLFEPEQKNLGDPKNEDQKKDHEVIHKKDGRLHIYVRQDKYKGELKSRNWVGRLYKDGKQKIFSSGTQNLEEAIPILEKWFDEVQASNEKEATISEEAPQTTSQETAATKESIDTSQTISASTESTDDSTQQKSASGFLSKIKNIKFNKPNFGKKEEPSAPAPTKVKSNLFKNRIGNFFKSRLGKSSAKGEEIVGVEITSKEIRLAQISSNKANQWILDRFYTHKVDLPEDASVLDNKDKLGEELSIALQKSKVATPNAAIAIPVTSAIIRVVTAPLMKDEELQKAIETNSLWENLVQLTDNLDDYSIFHQVINRSQKDNTMDILFVASKLADINNYTSIIKQSGLNPVIIDVKCFALKSAVDQINQISKSAEDANLTAVLEFGLDENYLMILYDNNPIITDIFIRGQDRKILLESQDQEEKEGLSRRFITQVKQAIQDFETKYEKRIRNIKVVSDLKNVEDYLSSFRKNMVNVGFNLFDPIEGLKIPKQLEETIKSENRSYLSTVVGLAFRKLDVFGYYKFVTAVKNINLLPDRQGMIKKKKIKAFSNFAFKGIAGTVAVIYLILFTLSFWNINSYNKKLEEFDKVTKTHAKKTKEKELVSKELGKITTTLKLSKSLKSNKSLSYRILAQIAMSVPKRVKFSSISYDGKNKAVISGTAGTDKDILKLIENLSKQKLVKQASLSTMSAGKTSGLQKKKFQVIVKVKG